MVFIISVELSLSTPQLLLRVKWSVLNPLAVQRTKGLWGSWSDLLKDWFGFPGISYWAGLLPTFKGKKLI